MNHGPFGLSPQVFSIAMVVFSTGRGGWEVRPF